MVKAKLRIWCKLKNIKSNVLVRIMGIVRFVKGIMRLGTRIWMFLKRRRVMLNWLMDMLFGSWLFTADS